MWVLGLNRNGCTFVGFIARQSNGVNLPEFR